MFEVHPGHDEDRTSANTFRSPFTLPASIDYLDAVWRLRFGNRLVAPPGIERSARLAFTATSPEEADSRLSALAEVFKGLTFPVAPVAPVSTGTRSSASGRSSNPRCRPNPMNECEMQSEFLMLHGRSVQHQRIKERCNDRSMPTKCLP